MMIVLLFGNRMEWVAHIRSGIRYCVILTQIPTIESLIESYSHVNELMDFSCVTNRE